ncbi:MAG TPA: tetratricopeptide repeat protein [Thermoanaerobaculia bacterium]|jgi:tetratricopeptide (TPR) repeat protein|nr:tetratricopeptide repeat protein [Thermoanaerobaculia bacterium]
MTDRHPDRATLERFFTGELTDEQDRALQRHVFTCPSCEERLLGILPVAGEDVFVSLEEEAEHRTLIHQIVKEKRPAARRRRLDLAAERAQAAGLWEELRHQDSESRRRLVASDGAYQTWGLFELLVDRSHQTLPQEPREAEDLVRLALHVTDHLDAGFYGETAVEAAKVKAWTHFANTLRVRAHFRQAEQAFHRAERHLAKSWFDPVDEAMILEFKGAMRRAQGRYQEALELLDDAIALYREVNESHHHGRALMVKGLTLQYRGEPEAAAECFRTSLFLLDGQREPRLLVMSQCNLVGCLHDGGHSAEAAVLIPEAKALIDQVGKRSDLLRITWIEGKVRVALGQWAAAERAFRWIREGFIQDELAFDAALVSLDLAGLYIRQGKTAEARLLAEETLPVFRSREVHREALAALIVFQRAAEMEQLTLGLVEEVSDFLERARNNPDLRFRGEA